MYSKTQERDPHVTGLAHDVLTFACVDRELPLVVDRNDTPPPGNTHSGSCALDLSLMPLRRQA